MTAPVRLGVIGVGCMGQGHCGAIAKVADARLTAVCDTNPEVGKQIAAQYQVPFFRSHRKLLAAKVCDAVLVVTPHPEHPKIAIDAMRAGLHVMCEKPLTERVSTADEMIRVAAETKVVFAIDFQRRTEPAVLKALELVRGGALGKLYRRTLISPEFRTQRYYDSGGWRATWKGEGGGVMMNQSPHVLDLFILLGGMPNRVIGRTETRLHHIEVEDLAEAMLAYPDGGTGSLYCSTCEAGPGQMIELFGDRGKLSWRDGRLQCWEFDQPLAEFLRTTPEMWGSPKAKEVPLIIPEAEAGHVVVLRRFVGRILRGEPLVAPGEEGLRSLELANAVWLSSATGKAVDLPLSRQAYDRFLRRKRRESTFVKNVHQITETDPQHKV